MVGREHQVAGQIELLVLGLCNGNRDAAGLALGLPFDFGDDILIEIIL
jgi:hypothetical protein